MCSWGCGGRPINRLHITDYRADRPPAQHYEDFNEAYYSVDEAGLADIVLRTKSPSTVVPGEDIVQVVAIKAYWKAHPGKTFAEESMLNAQICYVLRKGYSAISYDGGGFAHYRINNKKGVLTGKLKGGKLYPLRRMGADLAIFERVGIAGKFKAVRDDRRSARIINDIERSLGPMPRMTPERQAPDY